MSIKADKWIRRMALEHKMIEPFVDEQVRAGVVSYGLSSYGYDIRVADEFKIFTNINNTVIDPKNFDPRSFVDIKADVCIVPPNSFALARTIEYFRIPRDVLTVCLGKSTYARCGIIVNVTPFEPEWEGFVTLEISNTTPLPAKIYANEGIAQVLFFQSDEPCERSYADKKGKYLKQHGRDAAEDLARAPRVRRRAGAEGTSFGLPRDLARLRLRPPRTRCSQSPSGCSPATGPLRRLGSTAPRPPPLGRMSDGSGSSGCRSRFASRCRHGAPLGPVARGRARPRAEPAGCFPAPARRLPA